MSVSFQSFQPQDVVPLNSLFDLGSAQHQVLQNQQQDLANQVTQNQLNDQQTVRDNAVAVGQGDPAATATSLAADPVRAQGIISGLQTQDTATRARVAWGLGQAGQAAQSILDLPPDQRQGAWTALRNQAIANGNSENVLPEQAPDTASLIAFRKNAIPAASLLNHQELRQTNSPYDPVDSPPTVPVPGGGQPSTGSNGQPPASNGGPTPAGSYSNALALRESNPGGKAPNYQATNSAGYLGAYQFGAERLNDLGVYTPAQGENLEDNAYAGQFNIPGFPNIHTAADFLASPAAQNAVQGMSVHDIHDTILNTPGAQNYSEASLQAAAHIGGKAGMQKYVETAGTAHPYDPADSNGTHISDYVRDFAGYGTISQPAVPPNAAAAGTAAQPAPQVANTNQPPSGGTPATYANTGTTPPPGIPDAAGPSTATGTAPAAPGFQNMLADLNSGQPDGSMASAPGTQTASLTGTTGLPPTATDATSAPVSTSAAGTPALPTPASGPAGTPPAAAGVSTSAPAASPIRGGPAGPALAQAQANPPAMLPVSGGAPAGEPRLPVQNQLSSFGGGAPPGSSAPNSLLNVGGPQSASAGSGAAAAPQNPLATLTSSPASAGVPPAATSGTSAPVGFQIPPGTHMLYDGRTGAPTGLAYDGSNLPYKPPEHTVSNGVDIVRNPYTGAVIGTQRLFDDRRTTAVKLPNGQSQVYQGNQPVGAPIGSPTYDIDVKQYQKDQDDQREDVDELAKSQESQIRLQEAANLISQGLNSGKGGQVRNDLAAYIETYAPGTSGPAVERLLRLQPAAAGQEFAKIQIKAAGQDEREAVGGRAGLGTTQLFLRANPSLDLLPDANRQINNLQRVINVQQQDYLQARNAYINQQGDAFTADTQRNRYSNASHFDQQWQTQDNAHTYLGAAEAVNGKPFAQWSKGLQPASVQRAIGVAQRAAPDASLNIGSASNVPVSALTYLQNNPGLAAQFDQKYGQGTAALVLGR